MVIWYKEKRCWPILPGALRPPAVARSNLCVLRLSFGRPLFSRVLFITQRQRQREQQCTAHGEKRAFTMYLCARDLQRTPSCQTRRLRRRGAASITSPRRRSPYITDGAKRRNSRGQGAVESIHQRCRSLFRLFIFNPFQKVVKSQFFRSCLFFCCVLNIQPAELRTLMAH